MENETKYDYIWSRDQLKAFLSHSSKNVRSWAASRILELYPDLKDEMIDIIPQTSQDVVTFLFDGLSKLDSNEGKVEPLLRYYQIADNQIDKFRAAILLDRYGYIFSEKELADLPLHNMTDMPSTETGFSAILKRSVTAKTEESGLFYNLAYGCGSDGLYQLLTSNDNPKEKRQTLKDLAEQWQCHLPDVSGTKDVPGALRSLEDVFNREVDCSSEGRVRFPAIMKELDRDSARRKLIAASLKEHLSQGNKAISNFLPLLQSCCLSVLRDTACRTQLSREDLDLDDFWRVLTMRSWRTTSVDAGLKSFLQSQELSVVMSGLREIFECEEGWIFAGYAFRCLEAANISGRHELLLEALNDEWDSDIADDADEIINKIRPEIVETALELWKEDPPENAPMWLRMYPIPLVVQHLVDNFHNYFTSSDPRFFVELLGEIASPLFFEPLLNEWRPGEPAMAEHIKTIAEINNLTDKRLGPVIQEVEATEESFNSLKTEADLTKFITQKKLQIPLRCTVCNRVYHYPVECLYLGEEEGEFIIGDIIQCKGCGSIETYELVRGSFNSLSVQLGMLIKLSEAGEIDKKDLPVKGMVRGIMAGGRKFKTVAEAYHYISQAVERDPQNPDLQIRLAKIFDNGNRPDLALPHYKEVFKQDPQDSEAVNAIASILLKQKRVLEAVPYLEKLPDLVRQGNMGDTSRRELFISLVGMANTVQKEAGYQIQIVPVDKSKISSGDDGNVIVQHFDFDFSKPEDFEQAYSLFMGSQLPVGDFDEMILLQNPEEKPVPRTVEKVGRNDPCPCGSGKKYKKCCGR